ncbi:MAG: hypothetical protein HQM10_17380 [Candidatus Riflebacteria bacterium]|nr:hypothetical protein [Candidatus Riflebacteria bacterium]
MKLRSQNRKSNQFKKKSILLSIGPGADAIYAPFIIHSLQQAGFAVSIAFFPETEKWINLAALKELSGNEVSINISDFSFSIVLSPPLNLLRDFHYFCPADETMNFLLKKSTQVLFLVRSKTATLEALGGSQPSQIWDIRELPTNPFNALDLWEKSFSEIISYFSTKSLFRSATFVQCENPEDNSNQSFLINLKKSGLNPVFYKEDSSVLSVISPGQKNIFINLNQSNFGNSTYNQEIINSCSIILQRVQSEKLDIIDAPSKPVIYFSTESDGEIRLLDGKSKRIFPNLTDRTAESRLSQYLIDRADEINVQSPSSRATP